MSHQARWKKAGLKLDPGLSRTRLDETSWAVSERKEIVPLEKVEAELQKVGVTWVENPAYKEDRARWESLG